MCKRPFPLVLSMWIGSILVLLSAPAEAQSGRESRWTVRLTGFSAPYEGDFRQVGRNRIDTIVIDDEASGLTLAVEYRFWRRFAVELSAAETVSLAYERRFESVVSFTTQGELTFQPVLLALNVHLTPGRAFDVYAGPVYGRVALGEMDFGSVADDENASGFQVGFDWVFAGRGLALNANARYLDALVRFEFPRFGYFDLTPVTLSAGLAYRF